MHALPRKTHLCLLSGAWLLGRVCVSTETLPSRPGPCCCHGDPVLTPALCPGCEAPHPHLVKRSQGLGPWPSSGADQWQSILRMLLVRQVKATGAGPGGSDPWEPTEAAAGRERGGEAVEADTLTGWSPGSDSGRLHGAGLGGLDSDALAHGTWVGLESRLVPGGQVLTQLGHTLPRSLTGACLAASPTHLTQSPRPSPPPSPGTRTPKQTQTQTGSQVPIPRVRASLSNVQPARDAARESLPVRSAPHGALSGSPPSHSRVL